MGGRAGTPRKTTARAGRGTSSTPAVPASAPTATGAGLSPRDQARLTALQAAGLFVDLDAARISALVDARAADNDPLALSGRHALRDLVEAHLRAHRCAPPRDVVVASPQAVEHLRAAIDVDLDGVLAPDPDARIVHLRGDTGGVALYRPRTHHEWAALFTAALATLGDSRQFVSFDTFDWEEPLYLLVTPARAATLEAAHLLAYDSGDITMPAALPVTSRAVELSETLVSKGVTARAVAGELVLELDLPRAQALLARLRVGLHHDQRVRALVQRGRS